MSGVVALAEQSTHPTITENELSWLEIYSAFSDAEMEEVETALDELQRARIRFADTVADITGLTTREVLGLGGF